MQIIIIIIIIINIIIIILIIIIEGEGGGEFGLGPDNKIKVPIKEACKKNKNVARESCALKYLQIALRTRTVAIEAFMKWRETGLKDGGWKGGGERNNEEKQEAKISLPPCIGKCR